MEVVRDTKRFDHKQDLAPREIDEAIYTGQPQQISAQGTRSFDRSRPSASALSSAASRRDAALCDFVRVAARFDGLSDTNARSIAATALRRTSAMVTVHGGLDHGGAR